MQRLSATLLFVAVASVSTAQSRPKTVTGTYSTSWKHEAGCNLQVEQLADSTRIHFAVDCNRGAPSYNMGFAEDTAVLVRNVAVWRTIEFSGKACELRMKFTNGLVTVKQNGSDADCGFGAHVYASGTYKRVSRAKPPFDYPPDEAASRSRYLTVVAADERNQVVRSLAYRDLASFKIHRAC